MDVRFWCLYSTILNLIALVVIPISSPGMILMKKVYWAWTIFLAMLTVYSYKNLNITYSLLILNQIRSLWPIFDMEDRAPYLKDSSWKIFILVIAYTQATFLMVVSTIFKGIFLLIYTIVILMITFYRLGEVYSNGDQEEAKKLFN